VTAWVNGTDPRPHYRAAAAQSYFAGLIVADRLTPRISAATSLTADEIAAVAAAAIPAAGTPWDPDTFQAAMRDIAAAAGAIADMVHVGNRNLAHHHVGLLQHQLGVPRLRELAPPFAEW